MRDRSGPSTICALRGDRARYVIAAPTFGTGWLPTATIGGARPEAGTTGPAAVPVALWMLARPLWRTPLPQTMARAAAVLRGAAAIGAITALLQLSPDAARVLGGAGGASHHVAEMLGQVAMAVVWLALGA